MNVPLKKIIVTTLTATSLMTLFSYSLSALLNQNFKEPQILAILIQRLFTLQGTLPAKVIAWCVHYLVGAFFVVIYVPIWRNTKWKPGIINGLALGTVSGLFAVLVWHLTLELHPDPPALLRSVFYLQLVCAHALFGLIAAWVYAARSSRTFEY